MEYALGLMGGLIGGLLVQVFMNNPFKERNDKMARNAIKQLAKAIGYEVTYFGDVVTPLVSACDYDKLPMPRLEVNRRIAEYAEVHDTKRAMKLIYMILRHFKLEPRAESEHLVKVK